MKTSSKGPSPSDIDLHFHVSRPSLVYRMHRYVLFSQGIQVIRILKVCPKEEKLYKFLQNHVGSDNTKVFHALTFACSTRAWPYPAEGRRPVSVSGWSAILNPLPHGTVEPAIFILFFNIVPKKRQHESSYGWHVWVNIYTLTVSSGAAPTWMVSFQGTSEHVVSPSSCDRQISLYLSNIAPAGYCHFKACPRCSSSNQNWSCSFGLWTINSLK